MITNSVQKFKNTKQTRTEKKEAKKAPILTELRGNIKCHGEVHVLY